MTRDVTALFMPRVAEDAFMSTIHPARLASVLASMQRGRALVRATVSRSKTAHEPPQNPHGRGSWSDSRIALRELQRGGVQCIAHRVETEEALRRECAEFVPGRCPVGLRAARVSTG